MLLQYEDQEFFLENRIIQFDTLNASLKWKVFTVFKITTDFYYIDTEFPYNEMWLNFLDECHELSKYDADMSFIKMILCSQRPPVSSIITDALW